MAEKEKNIIRKYLISDFTNIIINTTKKTSSAANGVSSAKDVDGVSISMLSRSRREFKNMQV